MADHLVYATLPNRGLITVSGLDRFDFLQGLISNDIFLLQEQDSIYAALLTANGKFLYDFIILQHGDTLLIECEGGARATALYQRLKMFTLRAKVTFDILENKDVFVIFAPGQPQQNNALTQHTQTYNDPRHPQMGQRSFAPPTALEEVQFHIWDTHRIQLCVPDGSRDMIPEQSTLLECGMDTLNGVSFQKGCYMGQELTARMHYRGLTKKALYPVEFKDNPPPAFRDLHNKNDTLIGNMRSSCGQIGLALLKKEAVKNHDDLPFKLL